MLQTGYDIVRGYGYLTKAIIVFLFYWMVYAFVWYAVVSIHVLFGQIYFGNQVPTQYIPPFGWVFNDNATAEMVVPWVQFTTLSTTSYYFVILIPTILILIGIGWSAGKRIAGKLGAGEDNVDPTGNEDEDEDDFEGGEITNRDLIEIVVVLGILPPTIFFVDPGILASVLNFITSWNVVLSFVIVAIPATIFYVMMTWVIKGLILRIHMELTSSTS